MKGEKIKAGDLKFVSMHILPASGSSDAPSRYTTRPAVEARLVQLEKSWWEYIPESDIVIEKDVVTENIGLAALV